MTIEQREIVKIGLAKKFQGSLSVKLLWAEVPKLVPAFTIVRYAARVGSNWQEQEFGLRLDLDKQVFLDHFDKDPRSERYVRQKARKIVRYISSILN